MDAYRYAKFSKDARSQKRRTLRRAFVYELQPTGAVQITPRTRRQHQVAWPPPLTRTP
jgi:hypothetical protein